MKTIRDSFTFTKEGIVLTCPVILIDDPTIEEISSEVSCPSVILGKGSDGVIYVYGLYTDGNPDFVIFDESDFASQLNSSGV